MKKISARIGRVSLIETSDNQMEQYQESSVGKIAFLISAFPSIFWLCDMRSSIVMLKNYFIARVFARTAAVFLLMIGSIEVDTVPNNGFVRLE